MSSAVRATLRVGETYPAHLSTSREEAMGVIGVYQLLLLATPGAEEELNLLPFYIGIGVSSP